MKKEFYVIWWENDTNQNSQVVDDVAKFICKLISYSNNGYRISNVTFYPISYLR